MFSTGAIAWIGLAAAMYRNLYRSDALRGPRRRHRELAAHPQA